MPAATVHKGDFKRKSSHFLGVMTGHVWFLPPLCNKKAGFYNGKPNKFMVTRNWKDVTCKHCLKKK